MIIINWRGRGRTRSMRGQENLLLLSVQQSERSQKAVCVPDICHFIPEMSFYLWECCQCACVCLCMSQNGILLEIKLFLPISDLSGESKDSVWPWALYPHRKKTSLSLPLILKITSRDKWGDSGIYYAQTLSSSLCPVLCLLSILYRHSLCLSLFFPF